MADLSKKAKKLLSSFPPEYTERATAAMAEGKAFCPSCAWAGMSNCGYFDECGAFVMPNGQHVDEETNHG